MAGIKDVAEKSGVSISTVSYVMSGKRSVRDDTKRKVIEAARSLGYRPKHVEHMDQSIAALLGVGDGALPGMPSGRPRTKVLALSSPVHEYTDYTNYAAFFFALATRAKRYGYDILLLMHEYGDRELVRVTRNGMVDGIMLLDVLMEDSRADLASTLDVPVVSVGYPANTGAVYSVDLDFERMGREAISRIADLGHKHVVIVGTSDVAYEDGSNYLIRFRDAVTKYGLDLGVKTDFVASTGYGMADMRLMLDSVFASAPQTTAIICQTNATHVNNLLFDVVQKKFGPKVASTMRAVYYFPQLLPIAVASLVMGWIFRPQNGALNALLKAVGLGSLQHDWLGKPDTALIFLMLIMIWIQVGYPLVIFMSGLQRVDPELYEAASLDGANWWQRFLAITLPAIKPEIFVVALTCTIAALKVFGPVYMLTKGGPGTSTIVPSYYSYVQFFQSQQVGYGATIATALTVVIIVVAVIFTNLQEKVAKEDEE